MVQKQVREQVQEQLQEQVVAQERLPEVAARGGLFPIRIWTDTKVAYPNKRFAEPYSRPSGLVGVAGPPFAVPAGVDAAGGR